MPFQVALTFFNAALVCVVTSFITLRILKKEYDPFIKEETEKQKINNTN